MVLSNATIEELQRHGLAGDKDAIMELGRRALKLDFCRGYSTVDGARYCEHAIELDELKTALDNEIPPECPHCGKWITKL